MSDTETVINPARRKRPRVTDQQRRRCWRLHDPSDGRRYFDGLCEECIAECRRTVIPQIAEADA